MATALGNRVNLLVINKEDSLLLADLYPYSQLKAAQQENLVWVKNIPDELILTATIQRIPSQQIYSTLDGQLFYYGKLMPIGQLPDLSWQPIQEYIQVALPDINPNYFGVQERLPLQLVSRVQPAKASFLLANLSNLEQYLATAAAWRLKSLSWTVVGKYHALLKGSPMATLEGQPYWLRGRHILPLGWDLEWPILAKASAHHLDPTGKSWIFWQKNSHYGLIPKNNFKSLSRSSFHHTQALLNSTSL